MMEEKSEQLHKIGFFTFEQAGEVELNRIKELSGIEVDEELSAKQKKLPDALQKSIAKKQGDDESEVDEGHDCNKIHPDKTHKEWDESKKLEAQFLTTQLHPKSFIPKTLKSEIGI